MTIQPIETSYRGHRFRSRLEARWAVFFDALGVHWEYEPNAYRLPSGHYLPDFLLSGLKSPGEQVWFEVKPAGFCTDPRWHELASLTGKPMISAHGMPRAPDLVVAPDSNDSYLDIEGPYWDQYYAFAICNSCGAIGVEYEGRAGRVCRHVDDDEHDYHEHNAEHPRIVAAYQQALSARFDRGIW